MRENMGLFRGKPKNEGDFYFFSQTWDSSCKDGFVYGNLVIAHNRYYICVYALCQNNLYINNGLTSMIEVDPATVGEFTGFTDKNGARIFESDILKIAKKSDGHGVYYPLLEYPANVIVKWDLCAWMWEVIGQEKYYLHFPDAWCHYKCEVIGNIHDNPELIGGCE